jgi:uncharacterized RDD family membrane protein YckC
VPWSDDVRIETPEQIDVAVEIAGLGSRFMGWIVDLFWKALLVVVVLLLGLVLAALVGFRDGESRLTLVVTVGVCYFLCVGYDIYFEVRRNGQSPGKKAAGTRVIREGGAPVDFGAAGVRNLLALADFLPFGYLGGGLLILLGGRGQRLGDMAAGTLVVRERALAAPGDAPQEAGQWASDEFAFTADQLAACRPEDRHVLRAFFQRYQSLAPQPRRQLAANLAAEFLRKTAYQPREPLHADGRSVAFLASLYRDLEQVARQGR